MGSTGVVPGFWWKTGGCSGAPWFWAQHEVIDLESGQRLPLEPVGGKAMTFEQFSADGRWLAIAYYPHSSADASLRISNAVTAQTRYDFKTEMRAVLDVGVTSDTNYVVFAHTTRSTISSYGVSTPSHV